MSLVQSDRIIRTLKEQGAVVLPRFFAEEFAEQMRAEAITLLNTPVECVKATTNSGDVTKRFRPELLTGPRFPALGRALDSAFCREIAYGYDPKCSFFVDALIQRIGTSAKITDIHYDMRSSLKFMIYLSDVGKESAAFRYCFGSHRENREFRDRFLLAGGKLKKLPNIPAPDENVVLVDMEGPRGTLIIFDADGFHSAGVLQPGNERLLIRSHTLLSGWFNSRILKQAARRNPLRLFIPPPTPAGRKATGGRARAR